MPRKRVRYDKKLHKDNPWMTTGILKSINAKDKLYKVLKQTSKESPNYADIQTNFKTYRNIIRRSIMFAKRDYYQRMFNTFSNDMKKTWQTINDTLNRSKKSRKFPQLFKLSNGTTISDPKIIAEAFNDYFINIGTVDEPMNDQYTRYLHNKPDCNLIFHSITKDSVMQIIDGLKPKSSTGVDNISNKLLKSSKTFIVAPLTIIINQMFQVGKFPDLLKISKVLPIYKKDDDSLFSNYRPISLLPSVSKIFERAIMIQLTEYLEDNKLIHSNQYGFRKFHSTEYAALHLADYLNYEMDSRRTPVTIHLDLSKAFDCLSHSILLDKLRFYGINEMAYNLMKNYLENRKQFVQFDSCSSKMKSIDKGVPQGSILGPLLFLIYINDIPNSSNILNFLMYADDTTLHCCLEDIEDDNKEFRINQELQHVQDWLKVNRLALNVKKTKYMMFHKHNKIVEHLDLHVNNNAIEKIDNFNFLGLHLNTRLTWHTHVSEISKKISRAVGIIKKMQWIFPTEILLAIYNALVLPHINYCILSWGADSNTIFILQKKAVRAIVSAVYNAHTEPFFKLYNLLKIEDIYKFRLLVLYHNISHLKTPQYLDIFLQNTSQGNIHYAMRNPRLQLPVHFHEFIKTTCRYQLPTLLNNLNSESEILKHVIANIETTTLLGLKRIMKNYFLDKYS